MMATLSPNVSKRLYLNVFLSIFDMCPVLLQSIIQFSVVLCVMPKV